MHGFDCAVMHEHFPSGDSQRCHYQNAQNVKVFRVLDANHGFWQVKPRTVAS